MSSAGAAPRSRAVSGSSAASSCRHRQRHPHRHSVQANKRGREGGREGQRVHLLDDLEGHTVPKHRTNGVRHISVHAKSKPKSQRVERPHTVRRNNVRHIGTCRTWFRPPASSTYRSRSPNRKRRPGSRPLRRTASEACGPRTSSPAAVPAAAAAAALPPPPPPPGSSSSSASAACVFVC